MHYPPIGFDYCFIDFRYFKRWLTLSESVKLYVVDWNQIRDFDVIVASRKNDFLIY
jgi:hypothetical protein